MKQRTVGTESQKSYLKKIASGFFTRYMSGKGLDIGFVGYQSGAEPILPSATGVDFTFPGYDGTHLPFGDESQDYVYSSHCLEHISDAFGALQEWYRVLKIGGYMVLVVPHQYLYEKRVNLPSKWNEDHKRFYTPGVLLMIVEGALKPNSYRVRLLQDEDAGFDPNLGPDVHSGGQYEITLVLEKIQPYPWDLA